MKIRDVLGGTSREVHAVDSGHDLAHTIKEFADSKVRCLAVTDGGSLVGVVTIRDLLKLIDRRGAAALGSKVTDAMTHDVVTVTPDASIEDAEALFAEKRFNHLPVVEGERLVGIVTPADVLGRHLEDVQEGAVLLRDYIAGVYF